MSHQTLLEIREEADISKRLWVKVVGMLCQNWCLLQPTPNGNVDLVFFDDRGDVFDWRSANDFDSAQASLRENGFMWMWETPSFYSVAGMPKIPIADVRQRTRPIYSSDEYWVNSNHAVAYRPHEGVRRSPTFVPMNDVSRFLDAQDLVWYAAIEELAEGHKQSHWMWFMFPQLRGLGTSRLAHYFGLENPAEAAAFWDHDVLGNRLLSCFYVLLDLPENLSAVDIFGPIDAQKLLSCMTLFESVSNGEPSVTRVLDRFFGGKRCSLTQDVIRALPSASHMRFSF
jgi:uncharacterized protein (DUF1810 family)